MGIGAATSFRPHAKVLYTPLRDGTAVLLHLETKFYFTLNQAGVFVWHAIERGPDSTLASLTEQLCAEFEVDAATAERDLRTLLGELEDEGIIETGSETGR